MKNILKLIKEKLSGKAPEEDGRDIVAEGQRYIAEEDDRDIIVRLKDEALEASDPNNMDKLQEKVEELKGKAEEQKEPEPEPESKEEQDREPEEKKEEVPKKIALGLDIGTSRILSLKSGASGDVISQEQLNAFFTVPDSPFVKEMLDKNGMEYAKIKNDLAVIGYGAQEFASKFNGEIRRPMKTGLLKPAEPHAITVIKEIINLVIPRAETMGQSMYFSIPAPQAGFESDLIFHEGMLRKYLAGMGYSAKSITEGTAVVLSELAEDNYTGIGISMGGGMCNVCFSFLAVPVIVFSIPRGGDDVDIAVSRVASETVNRVRVIKEESLDFSQTPRNNMENAFHIYYDDLIISLLNRLSALFSQAENLPKLSQAIPIVLAGGTCLPNGFNVKFDKILRQTKLPIEISEVRTSADPARATANGALMNALL